MSRLLSQVIILHIDIPAENIWNHYQITYIFHDDCEGDENEMETQFYKNTKMIMRERLTFKENGKIEVERYND